MYAVVKTGGKQYRVAVGDKVKVETFKSGVGLPEEGDSITLDQVLMIADGDNVDIGTPLLDATVEAKVLANGRGEKLRIVKFRRRQNSRTRTGHRQNFTELEITSIGASSGKKAKSEASAKKKSDPGKKSKAKTKETVAAKKASKSKPKAAAKQTTSTDDLRKISGVGPVIVGKLNGLGITSFQQIADFSDKDIARIDEELNFKGRIERDNWVQQAKDFLDADKEA